MYWHILHITVSHYTSMCIEVDGHWLHLTTTSHFLIFASREDKSVVLITHKLLYMAQDVKHVL